MHVERTNSRGVVKNIGGEPIIIAEPEKIPKFMNEQNTKRLDFQTLMKDKELWTKYTGPFHKEGDAPEEPNVDKVYRALWLDPKVTFKKYEPPSPPKHQNFLYEAMPFSTSSSFDTTLHYLQKGALRHEGYVPHIFIIYLQKDKDAYIDALKGYNDHTASFRNVGFLAKDQLEKQKEITLYPGRFQVIDVSMKDGVQFNHVMRVHTEPSWIIKHGGLVGGTRRRIHKKRRIRNRHRYTHRRK